MAANANSVVYVCLFVCFKNMKEKKYCVDITFSDVYKTDKYW